MDLFHNSINVISGGKIILCQNLRSRHIVDQGQRNSVTNMYPSTTDDKVLNKLRRP